MERYGLDPIGLRPTSVFGEGRGQRIGAPGDHCMVAPELALPGQAGDPAPGRAGVGLDVRSRRGRGVHAYLSGRGSAHRMLNVSGECRESGEINQHLRTLSPQAPLTVSNEPRAMNSLLKTERLRETLKFHPEAVGGGRDRALLRMSTPGERLSTDRKDSREDPQWESQRARKGARPKDRSRPHVTSVRDSPSRE